MSEEEGSVVVTQRLVNFLQAFIGDQVTVEQAEQINRGELDWLVGSVESVNYKGTAHNLSQVSIRTISRGNDVITISSQYEFRMSGKVLDLLNDGDLINRPRTVYASNLNDFQAVFQKALESGIDVACTYNRVKGDIIQVSNYQSPADNNSNESVIPVFAAGGTGNTSANNPPPPPVP